MSVLDNISRSSLLSFLLFTTGSVNVGSGPHCALPICACFVLPTLRSLPSSLNLPMSLHSSESAMLLNSTKA